MTSIGNLSPIPLYASDRRALLALWDADQAVLDSLDVGWHHDLEFCDGSGECVCPELACPCSPGHVLSDMLFVSGSKVDVFFE